MPNFSATLSDVVVGDDFDVERSVGEVPEDAAVVKAWLTIKRWPDDYDMDALIQKAITSAAVEGVGVISDDGDNSTRTAEILFQLTHTDTALLEPEVTYVYDIQVLTDTDKVFTVEAGTLTPRNQITITNS